VERTIPEVFADQARRRPDHPAVAGDGSTVTYRELDAAANRHARAVLDRCGPGPGRTALLLTDDAAAIAATLGVLRAGKTAVVLNPEDPPSRLGHILRDAAPELFLADSGQGELAAAAAAAGASPAAPMTVDASIAGPAVAAPDVMVDPGDLAYLFYTSGSTGLPKGVMQTHRSLLHSIARLSDAAGVESGDRLPLFISTSGWGGAATTWQCLLNGATVCPFPLAARGMTGLARWIVDQEITRLGTFPSILRHIAATFDGSRRPAVRLVTTGGESVLPADLEACQRAFGPECEFVTMLGSTEAGPLTMHRVAADPGPDSGPLPAGRALDWVDILLLDEDGAPVAPGEIGEIVVRNDHMTPGYWNDEALNAARFPDPHTFRTGDLGRFSPDGVLTVLGRTDMQVKVRGNRILLTDVEGALAAVPGVTAAAVCATPGPRGHDMLMAFLTTRPGAGVTAEDVRRALRPMLPEREIPTGYVFLDALPVTPQGKVDRAELARTAPAPAPDADAPAGEATDTETVLAGIWAAAFEVERVAVASDFFQLGGDSLTAAVIASEVYETFGVELELRDLVQHRTVAGLAEAIDGRRASPVAGRPPLVRISRDGPLALSFAQERTWRTSQTPEQSAGYTDATGVRMRGPLDVAVLRQALERFVERHEVLRTTFPERDGRPVQLVHPPGDLDLPLVDVSDAPDPEQRTSLMLDEMAAVPFDVRRGPLLRLRLVRTAPDDHTLLWVDHHIVSDAASWRVFFQELRALYEAGERGAPDPLEAPALQYADFAAWERECLRPSSPYRRAELAWWRETLRDAPPSPRPPFARAAPDPAADPAEGVARWGLDPEVSDGLARLAREETATFYMVRLAAFAAQLAVETASDDLVLGTYASGRPLRATRTMFGFFSNLVTLRLRLTPELTFREAVRRVRDCVAEISAHDAFPYELLCEDLRREGIEPPAIQLIYNPSHDRLPRISGLELSRVRLRYTTMPWGFTFSPNRYLEASRCAVAFDARIHDPAEVREFIERYRRFAAQVAQDPERPIGAVPARV
jgi:amino acid adenylation domain-containing protein